MAISFTCQHEYDSGFTLDLQFASDHRVTALFGPSGSGKTTVLSLIAGLLRPQVGRIAIGDHVLLDSEQGICLQPEQRRVGLLFQDHNLFPHMRVSKNILYGWKRRRGEGIPVERVIKTLELEDLQQRFPRSLSGGQRQRVALARAIVSRPQLLLLDEPLTAVDEALRDRITEFIARVIHEFELPTLLISHHRPLVDRLAEHVLHIHDGRLAN